MSIKSEKAKPRGGFRIGAGRPPASRALGSTKVIRVPETEVSTIQEYLDAKETILQLRASANVESIAELPELRKRIAIPFYSSKVPAGFPSPAEDHVEERLDPNGYLIKNDNTTFFVRVKGDSMVDEHIFNDDVLIVDRSIDARPGDIVLAVLDGEYTVKKLGIKNGKPRLIPANPKYQVIEVREGQDFRLFGVVTGSMRKFK